MGEGIKDFKRTDMCGQIDKTMAGRQVTLMGWVQRARNMGGLIFVWLRDRTGIVQVVFNQSENTPDIWEMGEKLRSEYVLAVRGPVALRAPEMINKDLKTGEIEVLVREARLLNESETPPFAIGDEKVNEAIRLKYRYLDLRRPSLQTLLMMRSRVTSTVRDYMTKSGFWEIETPVLTRSTPEGARDYLVPSRVYPGSYYALPQSPQIYKQLLMLSGMDKYFQMARCFRDEDNRADRQPEFTQCDVEMSFVEPEDVQDVIEGAFAAVFREVKGVELSLPLPRLTWREAMDTYGSDKPDTRFELPIRCVDAQVAGCGFAVFEDALKSGGTVRALRAPGGARFSRKEMDALGEFVKTYHVKGLAWLACLEDGGARSSFAKFMSPESLETLKTFMGVQPGDALFLIADRELTALTAMGQLRLRLGAQLGLIDPKKDDLLWITEFPLLEWSDEENRFMAAHHPFTMPMEEDVDLAETAPGKVRSKAYDLVYNGVEMGSGSIRIHDSRMQMRMFNMLGFSIEEAQKRFGFLLEAFKYGTPPHGGFAFGIDRLIMQLSGSTSLRDVLAFPKAQNGNCLMMETPSVVAPEQLRILGLLPPEAAK